MSTDINTGDIMLDAVINMPYEMAMATELSRSQFYSRAHQALEKLAASQERVKELAEKLKLSEAVADCLGRQVQIKDDDRICFRDKLKACEAERDSLVKDAAIGAAIERAAAELPDGYEIEITVERGAGSVYLHHPDGMSIGMDVDADNRIAAEINAAVDDAVESANAIGDAVESGRDAT